MKLTCSRLCVLSMLLVTAAEFAAAQPGSSAIKAQLPKELKQKVNLGESREQRLIQLLERLAKKSGVRIGFDHAGLEKLCKKSLQEVVIVPPPGTLPLGAAIELVASQIHGTLQERNRQWQIVPGHADISRFVSPATVQTQTAFLKMAEIERPVQAPAKDIVEFFG